MCSGVPGSFRWQCLLKTVCNLRQLSGIAMSNNYTSFSPGAHDNDSLFTEYERNVGGAYRDQAMELIDACRHITQVANVPHQDNDLRRYSRPWLCLHSKK